MDVYYWSDWYKKKNSTRQPTTGTKVTVTLKEPCSLYAPVIEAAGIPRNANYFMIEKGIINNTYDCYYFVSDVVAVTAGITRFLLEFDPMATFKTTIEATPCFVERANSASANDWLNDPLNQPTDSVTIQAATTALQYTSGGTTYNLFDTAIKRYLLSTMGTPTYTPPLVNGIAKNYICSAGDLTLIAVALNTNTFLQNLVAEMTNPMQAIIGCKCLPVNMSGASYQAEYVTFGSYSTTVPANVLTQREITGSVTLNLPTTMTGQQDYTHMQPYVTATIYLPFIGVCPLDLDQITGRTVTLRFAVDLCTGDLVYAIIADGTFIQSFSGNCASDVPVSGGNNSSLAKVGGILTAVGGAATGNPVLAATGVVAAAKGFEVHTQVNGSYSSSVGGSIGTDVVITCYVRQPAHAIGTNAATEGKPYGRFENVLSVFSGYVKCRNASVDLQGRSQDKETINSYMNGGFYIE